MTLDLDALEDKETMFGKPAAADFEADTLTLHMQGNYYASARMFAVIDADRYDELIRLARIGQRAERDAKEEGS